jgi:hypothetical protein
MDRLPFVDPLKFGKRFWPHVTFTKYQKDIIYSVVSNDETVVVAGNMLGKDFVSAFIVLWFFLSRSPCRIVTTSADYSQLEAVLWGEMRRFLQTSVEKLEYPDGVLVVNHMHIRKIVRSDEVPETYGDLRSSDREVSNQVTSMKRKTSIRKVKANLMPDERMCGLSYIVGKVAAKGEGMLGHHISETGDGIPKTLWVADEASGVDNDLYERASTWARRMLIIGNAYPCQNFFRDSIKKGDLVVK